MIQLFCFGDIEIPTLAPVHELHDGRLVFEVETQHIEGDLLLLQALREVRLHGRVERIKPIGEHEQELGIGLPTGLEVVQ